MIELTEQQSTALEQNDVQPLQVIDPRTQERFVLLRTVEYERLMDEYDDSPWTRDEIEALAWDSIERGGEDFEEYDLIPEKP